MKRLPLQKWRGKKGKNMTKVNDIHKMNTLHLRYVSLKVKSKDLTPQDPSRPLNFNKHLK